MSINTAHANGGVLLHSGEFILLYCRDIFMEFIGQNTMLFKRRKPGRIYLTSHRLIFVSKLWTEPMQSFSMPYVTITDFDLIQETDEHDFIQIGVHAQPNGNYYGKVVMKLTFKNGETAKFADAVMNAGSIALQNSNFKCTLFLKMPMYVATRAWYDAPQAAYDIPDGYFDWLPKSKAFTKPPPNSVFMSDNPAPFPGIKRVQIKNVRNASCEPFTNSPTNSVEPITSSFLHAKDSKFLLKTLCSQRESDDDEDEMEGSEKDCHSHVYPVIDCSVPYGQINQSGGDFIPQKLQKPLDALKMLSDLPENNSEAGDRIDVCPLTDNASSPSSHRIEHLNDMNSVLSVLEGNAPLPASPVTKATSLIKSKPHRDNSSGMTLSIAGSRERILRTTDLTIDMAAPADMVAITSRPSQFEFRNVSAKPPSQRLSDHMSGKSVREAKTIQLSERKPVDEFLKPTDERIISGTLSNIVPNTDITKIEHSISSAFTTNRESPYQNEFSKQPPTPLDSPFDQKTRDSELSTEEQGTAL